MLKEKSSFRDPAGQVFSDGMRIGREIYPTYFADYQMLMESGLYEELRGTGRLIPHKEISKSSSMIVIQPEVIPFISYLYEWCFSMLKQAAANTLAINRIAMEHGMMLKDASAYNIQYYKRGMVLIDTLSFIKYEPGMPWGAYPQFLQHFLYPLLVMKYRDTYLGNHLSEIYLDGIPAKLVSKLLPYQLRFNPSMIAHVYAQSLNFTVSNNRKVNMSRQAFDALMHNLENLVVSLDCKTKGRWTDYETDCHYSKEAAAHKANIMAGCLAKNEGIVLDLGANTGIYSQMAVNKGHEVIAVDNDPACVELLCQSEYTKILPLVIDLCNPSPAIGWENTERSSFWDRVQVDTIMALALIHHLCVANNVPLARVASLLAAHCKHLIIEWVPLDDPKAQLLLGKKNIPPYSLDIFKATFSEYFVITGEFPIVDSKRVIYLMERR